MNYKVLCSDLDGTLLSTKNNVSDFTIQEIKRIRNKVQIILVSARMPSGMHYLQERLGISEQPIICYNGALILKEGKELFSTTISSAILSEVNQMSIPLGIDLGIYIQDEWYVPKTSERVEKEIRYTKTQPRFESTHVTLTDLKQRGAHKVMLMCTKESADKLMPLLEMNFGEKLHLQQLIQFLLHLKKH